MDADFLKSDQMEMMLMQMDDFSGAFDDEFSSHNDDSSDDNPMPAGNTHVFDHFHVQSPSFHPFHHPNTPLSAALHQDPSAARPSSDAWPSDDYSVQPGKRNSMAAMREMIFRIAAMQPVQIDPESVKPPKRKNVKISTDPQSVAARHRREKISERIRILQRLVPGGTKMDTASMLDEAIHYVKFLKNQVQSLERVAANRPEAGIGFPVPMSSGSYFPAAAAAVKGYHQYPMAPNVEH